MKKILIATFLCFFGSTALANNLEVQVSADGLGGSTSTIVINDKDLGDTSPWGLQAEAYYSITDNIQVGGLIGFSDADQAGVEVLGVTLGATELSYSFGLAARYNFNSELQNSFWVGAGALFVENGLKDVDSTSISVFAQVGKRFAISKHLLYTPNLTFRAAVAGDEGFDSGSVISANLISFSGFLNL